MRSHFEDLIVTRVIKLWMVKKKDNEKGERRKKIQWEKKLKFISYFNLNNKLIIFKFYISEIVLVKGL